MENLAIKIENVSKEYRLGTIGGGTLQGDLQSLWAKIRHKEDPNSKIGETEKGQKGDRFMALNGVSFEVKKGEALGIIGHNGAGKSTLLKLLCRVTAPSGGKIAYDGRIASMLEVGTGFHPELTGRENVYMNGAILGMTKAEIDKKFDQIVKFAEMEKFIDTPVKRYSSGMYVKLAFSVAAHLDSEIMIMDEVLAVGDMAFQKKCLTKMRETAKVYGRTVLYVSHNMNTIRQLCDRCVVLDHGQVIFDGDVEEAITLYLNESTEKLTHNSFEVREYDPYITADIKILSLDMYGEDNLIKFGNKLNFKLKYEVKKEIDNLNFRFTILYPDRAAVATTTLEDKTSNKTGIFEKDIEIDISQLAPADYIMQIVAFEPDNLGNQIRHDYVPLAVSFTVFNANQLNNFEWNHKAWGAHVLPPASEK